MFTSRKIHNTRRQQRGAALMVMLIIVILGSMAFLVSAMSSSAVANARNQESADALAKAKDALIGRAVSDANLPGSLPCPDTNNDGSAETFVGVNCPSYIGRLPWRTLGLPDLRDGSGERLWYALAYNFRDQTSPPHIITSDTSGDLVISGTMTANNVVAIIFAPGNALTGQDRSSIATTSSCTISGIPTPTNNLCLQNYLEGSNATPPPNLNYQSAATGIPFNDQMIYITHDQLFASVEMRVAREVKKCLDDYATADGGKYPWASPDTTYTGTNSTLFGWLSNTPSTYTSSDPAVPNVNNALSALQAALDAYNSSATGANKTALINASNTVISLKTSISGASASMVSAIDAAGDNGNYFANGTASYATATSFDSAAVSALASAYGDPSMPNSSWNAVPACNAIFNSTYWPDWKQSVLYQVTDGYRPGGSASCTPSSTCVTINGSGNTTTGTHNDYRATVIVARQALALDGQTRPSSNISDYLDGSNQTPGTTPPTFATYKSSDPTYSTVNDLVLCLDGSNNCK